MNIRLPFVPALAIYCLALTSSCQSVPVPADDPSPPKIKLDVYGDGYPDENPLSVSDSCCKLRRPVPLQQPLTLVASAEDADSGVKKIEIIGTTVRRCMITRSFPGHGPVPDGPPVGQTTISTVVHSIALNEPHPGSGNASTTLLVNANTTLASLAPDSCPNTRFAVNDDPPTYVTTAEQSTTYCGVRVVVKGTNSLGKEAATSSVFLYEGALQSGTPTPCTGVVE